MEGNMFFLLTRADDLSKDDAYTLLKSDDFAGFLAVNPEAAESVSSYVSKLSASLNDESYEEAFRVKLSAFKASTETYGGWLKSFVPGTAAFNLRINFWRRLRSLETIVDYSKRPLDEVSKTDAFKSKFSSYKSSFGRINGELHARGMKNKPSEAGIKKSSARTIRKPIVCVPSSVFASLCQLISPTKGRSRSSSASSMDSFPGTSWNNSAESSRPPSPSL